MWDLIVSVPDHCLSFYFVQNNHTKTEWVYLREMVQVSQDSEQREATFNITSGVKQPKHIFVYLQRTVRSSNQEHNPHILDTFKINADNYDCYLSAARLEVGNGTYYPELEYSESDKVRIYRDVKSWILVCSNGCTTKFIQLMTLGWPWLILRQGQIWSLMLLYRKEVKQWIFQKLLYSSLWCQSW